MIKYRFSYCPLIWMPSSGKSNNLINKLHEGSLRIISNDKESDFQHCWKTQSTNNLPERYGLETICTRTPFLWVNLPIDIELVTSLSDFKTKIKSWICKSLCLSFVSDFPTRLRNL